MGFHGDLSCREDNPPIVETPHPLVNAVAGLPAPEGALAVMQRDGSPSPSRLDRVALGAVVALLCLFSALALAPRGPVHRAFEGSLRATDFRAFYCAARVAREGQDPYLGAPLERCETHDAGTPEPVPGSTTLLDPAPQPGYDFALMEPLALLPFFPAAVLWNALLAGCIILSAWLLRGLTGAPFLIPLAAFAIVLGYQTLPYGQLSPIPIVAMCLAAYFLQAQRFAAAGIAAAFAMFVPQLGAPLCGALVLWQPNTRLALVATGALLAGLSLLALGFDVNVHYLAAALPAQQVAALDDPSQYSLTWLLHQFHASDAAALRVGSASYLVLLVLSIASAGRLARTLGLGPALALFPPAACTLLGPYIHIQQVAIALPFAIYAATKAARYRAIASLVVLVLALDWPAMKYLRLNALELLVIITLIAFAMRGLPLVRRSTMLLSTVALYALFAFAAHRLPATEVFPHRAGSTTSALRYGADLASTQMLVSREQGAWRDASWQMAAGKLPTWLALIALIWLGVRLARRPAT